MKIEIGEYIRTKQGDISKVKYVDEENIFLEDSVWSKNDLYEKTDVLYFDDEEEKKALEVLNNKVEYINNMPINTRDERTIRFATEVQKVANEIIDIANKIIYKQQKEIEELEQNRDEFKEEYIKLQNARYYNYITKDKIRTKIEELESLSKNITMQPSIYNYEIDLLKELLEEN